VAKILGKQVLEMQLKLTATISSQSVHDGKQNAKGPKCQNLKNRL
jgi:hypothetical protein